MHHIKCYLGVGFNDLVVITLLLKTMALPHGKGDKGMGGWGWWVGAAHIPESVVIRNLHV